MKRIMLIDPYFKQGLKGFSLGLGYIAGSLRYKYNVSVLDLTARSFVESKDHRKILKEELRRLSPDLVGITSTSPTHRNALEAAKIVKEYKDIPIIKGGVHETNANGYTLKNNPEIDYCVVGEGEKTIVELVDKIFQKQSAKGVKGVIYRDDNQIVNNGKRNYICNLDTLPMPARDLFYLDERYDQYYSANLFNGKKSTSIMTSRGCPYHCTFCSSKNNWDGMRSRSVKNVLKEIKQLYSQGFKGFMFEDDMSLVNKKWFLEFAKQLKDDDIKIEYTLQTRVDAIDEEITKALSDSGCKFMYFGIESGVQEILDKCKKDIDLGQAEKAFFITKKYGIKNMASIQFGLPGEDLENLSTVRETISVLNEKLKPDEVAISYTSLYPGSELSINEKITPEMYENYIEIGADNEISTKTAHGCYSIHPKNLTSEKIKEIEKILADELKIKRFKVSTFYNV